MGCESFLLALLQVPVISFAGWTIPSNIGVSAFGGNSLFGAFYERIGANLAHWPTGPSLDDPFWLYMTSWHIGLFVTMLLGQVRRVQSVCVIWPGCGF